MDLIGKLERFFLNIKYLYVIYLIIVRHKYLTNINYKFNNITNIVYFISYINDVFFK